MLFIEYKNNKGIALLFAIVLSGLFLGISFALSNLFLKNLILSSTSRESQKAFYSADAGMECMLFWDKKKDAFKITGPDDIECFNATHNVNFVEAPSDTYTATFQFLLTGVNTGECANIVLIKKDLGSSIETTIGSRGYNTCDTTNTRRVERGIRAIY